MPNDEKNTAAKTPSAADAELILKLYDLRREPVMRQARNFMAVEFWPKSADDVAAIMSEFGSERNNYLRQVIGYWEMACSFVNRGVIHEDLFMDYGGEVVFIYLKFRDFLPELRQRFSPFLLTQTEQLISRSKVAKDMAANIERNLKARAEKLAAAEKSD
jgi:hypothetical protein